jgi:hypothetical protein
VMMIVITVSSAIAESSACPLRIGQWTDCQSSAAHRQNNGRQKGISSRSAAVGHASPSKYTLQSTASLHRVGRSRLTDCSNTGCVV